MKTLCNRAILVEQGKIVFDGNPNDTVDYYIKRSTEKINSKINLDIKKREDRKGNNNLKIIDIKFYDDKGEEIYEATSGDFIEIRFL